MNLLLRTPLVYIVHIIVESPTIYITKYMESRLDLVEIDPEREGNLGPGRMSSQGHLLGVAIIRVMVEGESVGGLCLSTMSILPIVQAKSFHRWLKVL